MYIKKIANQILSHFGYKIIPKTNKTLTPTVFNKFNYPYIDNLLYGIVFTVYTQRKSKTSKFSIVQIGANDGITVDYVYPFAMNHMEDTKLFLIEPQIDIMEKLKTNYQIHPNTVFANIAIGEGQLLNLYRIKPELQKYYKGIIGSGITSANKLYVQGKAENSLPNSIKSRYKKTGLPLIEKVTVKSMSLYDAIENYLEETRVDWLQIDTEGYDDEIIYNSKLELLKPKIISYEISHFSKDRYDKLANYLDKLDYDRIPISNEDECAIKRS